MRATIDDSLSQALLLKEIAKAENRTLTLGTENGGLGSQSSVATLAAS